MLHCHVSYNLNSLEGGYRGDSIGFRVKRLNSLGDSIGEDYRAY